MAANVFEDRAALVGPEYGRVHDRHYRWILLRISERGLPCRRHRTQEGAGSLRRLLRPDGHGLYLPAPQQRGHCLLLGFPLGFFASGSFSPVGAFFTELFPSHLRGSGQGFSYNLGRGIGALFPTLVGFLSVRLSLGKAIAIFAVATYLVMILAVLLLPETRGKELKVYE